MKKATTTMKKTKSGVEEGKGGDSPSQRIDARIKELSDWRGEPLARIRSLRRDQRALEGRRGEQFFRGAEFGWAKMLERLPGVAGTLARRKGGTSQFFQVLFFSSANRHCNRTILSSFTLMR